MRPLVIDEQAKVKINYLVQYATENPYSMDDLLDIMNGQKCPPGDLPQYCITLDFGYRIVYSIEMQQGKTVRHISISVDTENKLPSPDAVKMIIKEFGFTSELEECKVTNEQISELHSAINVWEIIK